jgi:hypothetical protein
MSRTTRSRPHRLAPAAWLLGALSLVACAEAVDGDSLEGEAASEVDSSEHAITFVQAPDIQSIEGVTIKPKPTRPPAKPPSGPPAASFADLTIDGTLAFTADPLVYVHVTNRGTTATPGWYGGMVLGGQAMDASLYPRGSSTAGPLQPGQKGALVAWVSSPGLLHDCTRYRVVIDTVRQMQKDAARPYVYTNDSGIARSPCPLTWLGPINEATLYGVYPAAVVGDSCPNCPAGPLDAIVSDGTETPARVVAPEIRGKSLADIVGSFQSGRSTDNTQQLCSSCHYKKSADYWIWYKPPVAQNAAMTIQPSQQITFRNVYGNPDGGLVSEGATAWRATYGWAYEFVRSSAKQGYPLVEVFKKWIADGYQ